MFCVWMTGIPGSGKSTIAKELADELKSRHINFQILRLDEIRKIVTPNPDYSEKERDIVYRALAMMAKFLYDNGINEAKEGKIQLPGINAVYEEPENPELIIESEEISPKDAAAMIIKVLNM
ncbi:MAG: hypothetical protein CVT89_04870 [Candidatus Altiarchaeales archaeon HGW-Altiarchaeales-2]|nr:MAG: hypothetical protein CVT89_04870 [Candidatus Altiarchaeales archaeon HGW-Altiarchaeales-2]